MPIMSVNPEYLRARAKAAEVSGDLEMATALIAEAEAAELETDSAPADAAPQ